MRVTGFLAIVCALALANCVARPVEEVKYFQSAFAAVDQVGQPLIDELAVAERQQGREIAVRRAKGSSNAPAPEGCTPAWQNAGRQAGFIGGFCTGDARYFSQLGDPPATRMLRGSLQVIERYADALGQLAEGGNVADATGQIEAIGGDIAALLALVPGAQVGAAVIGPALQALKPVIEGAARAANAAEQRHLIKEGAPKVTELIRALRDATPQVFDTLIEAPAARLTGLGARNPDVAQADLRLIEGYRVTLSNYVVLLDELQAAWTTVVAALDKPSDPSRLAALARRTGEIRGYAASVRQSLAIIRSGGVVR